MLPAGGVDNSHKHPPEAPAEVKTNMMQCFKNWLLAEKGMLIGMYAPLDSNLSIERRAFSKAAKGYLKYEQARPVKPVASPETRQLTPMKIDPESLTQVAEMFSECLNEEVNGDLGPSQWPISIHIFIELGWQFVKNTGGRPYIIKRYDTRDVEPMMSRYRYSQTWANRGSELLSKSAGKPSCTRPDLSSSGDLTYVEMLNELGATLHFSNTPMTSWTHCVPVDLLTDDDGVVHYEDEPAETIQPVLPQSLQSNEDVLELIAMSKAPVPPAMVDQLVEAVEYAVEHWDNEEARILPGGYNLRSKFYNVFIHLYHPDHPNCITVGMKDTHSGKLEFVSKRGEIREYMAKVEAGMRPSDNGKLPGILFQAPIHDDDKQARGIPATASPFADLPMFAEPDMPA